LLIFRIPIAAVLFTTDASSRWRDGSPLPLASSAVKTAALSLILILTYWLWPMM